MDYRKDYYKIYEDGRVYSNKKNKFLKPQKNNCGYLQVFLACCDNKPRWFKIHRLVAEAFIPNPNGLPEVNHKDENKENNSVENLEWCDRSYNLTYNNLHRRKSRIIKLGMRKIVYKPKNVKEIYRFSIDGNLVGIYKSLDEASEKTGFKKYKISCACRGSIKKYKKCIWRYVQ